MKKYIEDYRAVDYKIYFQDQLLFVFDETNYLVFSKGTIKNAQGDLVLQYRRTLLGSRIRILFQKLEDQVVFKKERMQLKLFLENEKKELSIKSHFKVLGNFEGDVFVNDVIFGSIIRKYENRKSAYHFYFKEDDPHLIYYCLILFSIKYYHYIDEVP